MSAVENKQLDSVAPKAKSAYAQRLDSIAWAVLSIWIGVAILANAGWGWTLLGIGGIVLGVQGVLWQRSEAVDGFAVACGAAFVIGGAWVLFALTWPLAPVFLILLGAVLLWNATVRPRLG